MAQGGGSDKCRGEAETAHGPPLTGPQGDRSVRLSLLWESNGRLGKRVKVGGTKGKAASAPCPLSYGERRRVAWKGHGEPIRVKSPLRSAHEKGGNDVHEKDAQSGKKETRTGAQSTLFFAKKNSRRMIGINNLGRQRKNPSTGPAEGAFYRNWRRWGDECPNNSRRSLGGMLHPRPSRTISSN